MSEAIQHVTADGLGAFLDRRGHSVIHLDAEWDGYAGVVRRKMEELAARPEGTVSFGYMDVDGEQDHARSIGIRNVPACCYYRGRELMATVIGMQQDIGANLRIMQEGGRPDTSNGSSRG